MLRKISTFFKQLVDRPNHIPGSDYVPPKVVPGIIKFKKQQFVVNKSMVPYLKGEKSINTNMLGIKGHILFDAFYQTVKERMNIPQYKNINACGKWRVVHNKQPDDNLCEIMKECSNNNVVVEFVWIM